MTTPRPQPPPLEARCPVCSICGKETSYVDDDFECEHCGCRWPSVGYHLDVGEWLDETATQCQATAQPYLDNTWIPDNDQRKQEVFRCVRNADHDVSEWAEVREHANPDMDSWHRGWC